MQASTDHAVHLVIGIIEVLGSTLYCTALMIAPGEGVVGKHRKLMPTATERLVWGFGDGSTLDTMETPGGRVGTVICWENYMPLLRQAMYAKGVQIYCAPTADDRPTWQSTMQHIAIEGRTFVLSACQVITRDAFPADHPVEYDVPGGDTLMRGGSVIIDPAGTVLAGPVFDEETILYAELDPGAKTRSHLDFRRGRALLAAGCVLADGQRGSRSIGALHLLVASATHRDSTGWSGERHCLAQ